MAEKLVYEISEESASIIVEMAIVSSNQMREYDKVLIDAIFAAYPNIEKQFSFYLE
jgi:hypothetical protein